jgi:AcrR family transcriptional regulator
MAYKNDRAVGLVIMRKISQCPSRSAPPEKRVDNNMPKESERQQFAKQEDLSSVKDRVLIKTKQKQIVEGACKLFLKKGFHGTPTREIAAVCGMSKGQLYQYITSKDDIIFLTYIHLRDLWVKKFKAAGMDTMGDPLKRLFAALRMTMDFMMQNKLLLRFLETQRTYLNARNKELFLRKNDAGTLRFWTDLLKQVEADQLLACDAELGAKIIIQNIHFFIQNDLGRDKATIANYRETVIHFILRGLGLKAPA